MLHYFPCVPSRRTHVATATLLLLTALGCGAQPSPVTGRVKFKDNSDVSVLAGYEIAFDSDAKSAGAVGHIAADGTVVSNFENETIVIDGNTYDGGKLLRWNSRDYFSLAAIRDELGFERDGQTGTVTLVAA